MDTKAKMPEWLLNYAENVYSQSGEDGIVKKILEVLPENDNWCVEFGAWDGEHLSNVRNLVVESEYNAVLIEASKDKFKDLVAKYQSNDKVTTLNQFVNYLPDDNLDTILNGLPIPKNFDFLSIDVDGNDFHIWRAMSQYAPKVVCVEFNPTMPTEVHFIQKADPQINQGSSLLAFTELAKDKGYELVCVLNANAFYVVSEYFPLFKIHDNSPFALRKSTSNICYIFSGFDGQIFLSGSLTLPWHNIELNQDGLQLLPKFLRKYPLNYSKFELILFRVFKKKTMIMRKLINKFFH